MRQASVYTDGSGRAVRSPGGFAAIIVHEDASETVLVGSDPSTNSQRAELQAALLALEHLREPHGILLRSDSAYLVEGFMRGIDRWRSRGWTTFSGTPVANTDLWARLIDAGRIHSVTMGHVRGHSGVEMNERADHLARHARIALEASIAPRGPCGSCRGWKALQPCLECGCGL